MKGSNIKFEWKDGGSSKCKELDRQSMFYLMTGIMLQFKDNNEISTKLVDIIQKVDSMKIDKDRNRDCDVPMVSYQIENEEKILSIGRNHHIIWGILDELCKL